MNDLDIPKPLPVGMTEFNAFADRIIDLAGAFADRDSMIFAIATMIVHADGAKSSLPDSYFLERLRKSAANQVASQVFHDIKQRQAEALKAAEVKVADTTKEVVSDETSEKIN